MSGQTKNLVKGALVLSISGMIAKVFSLFFRVPLTHAVGEVGVGYYQMPYPLYTLVLAIAYVGLPTAISKMISEKMANNKYYEAHIIFKYSMQVLVCIGVLCSAIMIFGADLIIQIQGWVPESKPSLIGLGLTPLFAAIMGAYRGYFHGMQNMTPTAISQILRAVFRMIIGIGLAFFLLNAGYDRSIAAGGAAVGSSFGLLVGTLFLTYMYIQKRREIEPKILNRIIEDKGITRISITKTIIIISFPICIGSAIYSIMSMIDSTIVVRRLIDSGIDEVTASLLFGQLGNASSIINLPLTVSMALMVSLVPAISEAVEKENKQELINKVSAGLKMVLLLAFPAMIGLIVLAKPIMTLIFMKYNKGWDLLVTYSFSLLFIMIGQTCTSMLQGLGKLYTPIRHIFYGAVAKAVSNYVLVGAIGIQGAALSSVIGYGVYAVSNFLSVRKHSGYRMDVGNVVLKPLLSSIIMGGVTWLLYYEVHNLTHSNAISTLLSILVGAAVYGGMMFFTGILKEKDVKIFVNNKRILSALKKLHLIKE